MTNVEGIVLGVPCSVKSPIVETPVRIQDIVAYIGLWVSGDGV